MKLYPKEFEEVFSSDRRRKLNFSAISAVGMDIDKYTECFQGVLTDFYANLFDHCLKIAWMRRKFKYKDRKLSFPMGKNAYYGNLVFIKFLRRVIGHDIQVLTKARFFSRLESYFEELFPGFEEGDPFGNSEYYEFPFENITMEFLMPVYQMDERISLLKEADKQKMGYARFLDFVINHALSVNQETKKSKYEINHTGRDFTFFIKNNERKLVKK